MTWFEAFRGEFGFPFYPERRTSVTIDISLAAVVYACILISIATIIAAAGIKGKERWYTLLRVVYGLAVGSFIVDIDDVVVVDGEVDTDIQDEVEKTGREAAEFKGTGTEATEFERTGIEAEDLDADELGEESEMGLYGYCWQEGKTKVNSPYVFRSSKRFHGYTGVMIGLRKINITLTGIFEGSNDDVNYNEEIHLRGVRGPIDELRNCLTRGMPQPVLSVVEYLSVDAGGMRWGRSFHLAGYFANILLWTSFSFWLLANFLLSCVVFYGAALFTLTGVTMVLTSVIYHVLQPTHHLRMLCAESGFQLTYGWCFWSILVFGCLTTIIGLIVLLLEHKYPKKMAKIFLSETQFEIDDIDDRRKASTFSSASNQSVSQFHQNLKRRGSAPTLWHLNKGFNFGDINKENPVYEEAENENEDKNSNHVISGNNISGTITKSHSTDEIGSLSSTLSRTDSEQLTEHKNIFNSEKMTDSTEDRLKNIYINIEPSSSIGQIKNS